MSDRPKYTFEDGTEFDLVLWMIENEASFDEDEVRAIRAMQPGESLVVADDPGGRTVIRRIS